MSLLEYPEVCITPRSPYCDCIERELQEYGGIHVGPHYCPKHNVIVLWCCCAPEDLADIEKDAESIVAHETLHYVLCANIDEAASIGLDYFAHLGEFEEEL